MSALLSGGPIRLVNGGHVHRAFLHVADANEAFQTLLDHPDEARNQIYNVGNPANNVTIRQLAALMLDLYEDLTGQPSACRLEDISGEQFYGEGYDDADRLPPDVAKLKALGWAPRRDLITTLRETMEYYLADANRLPYRTRRHSGTVVEATA
jgi:UDP-apiose/xylose synthase